MIRLTDAPDAALKKLANEMLFGLINRDYGVILGKISYEYGRWTRERIQDELLQATKGRWVSEFLAINRKASPVLEGDAARYEYRHPLPIDGCWSDSVLVLRLHRKSVPLYAIELVGFVPQPFHPSPQPPSPS